MNLRLFRGDDYTISLEFTEGGVAKDITDWTIYFTLKKNLDDSDDDAVLKKDVTEHSDPTHGKTEIVLTNSDTDALAGVYDYDIQYKDNSTPAIVKTVITGKMTVEKDVTRRKV